MESIEIDIKMGIEWEEGGGKKGGAGKKKGSRPKVTHITPLTGSVCLNSVFFPSGESQQSSRDQHQHITSNTIRKGWS